MQNYDRTYLRLAIARLTQATEYFRKVTPNEQEDDFFCGINMAKAALDEAINPLLVKHADYEPLNDQEEILFDKLQFVLRFNDKEWANITHAQRFAAARVIMRQGGPDKIRHPVSGGHSQDMIGISFTQIFIGIEPDGYAHS